MRHARFPIAVGVMILCIQAAAAIRSAPYHEEAVEYANGGMRIVCTLTRPAEIVR